MFFELVDTNIAGWTIELRAVYRNSFQKISINHTVDNAIAGEGHFEWSASDLVKGVADWEINFIQSGGSPVPFTVPAENTLILQVRGAGEPGPGVLSGGGEKITISQDGRILKIFGSGESVQGSVLFATEALLLASALPDGTVAYAQNTDTFFFRQNGVWEEQIDSGTIPGTIATILTDHNKAVHDALGINAATVDSVPGTIAAVLTDHNRAAHDALGTGAALYTGESQTIVGTHTFNPTVAGVPFIVGANAVGQLVTGLNADTVDGVSLPGTIATVLTDHDVAAHNALGIDAATVDGVSLPGAIVAVLTDHDRAAHDALGTGNLVFEDEAQTLTLKTLAAALPASVAGIVRGAAAQSANLMEWQDSAGTVLMRVSEVGELEVLEEGLTAIFEGLQVNASANINAQLTVNGSARLHGLEGTSQQHTLIDTKSILLSGLTGASVTATNLIPVGSLVIGVTCRVGTGITGATSFDVGDGTDVDRFGAAIATGVATRSDLADSTVTTAQIYTAATNVVLTANGANFAGGSVRVTVHFIDLVAPSQ